MNGPVPVDTRRSRFNKRSISVMKTRPVPVKLKKQYYDTNQQPGPAVNRNSWRAAAALNIDKRAAALELRVNGGHDAARCAREQLVRHVPACEVTLIRDVLYVDLEIVARPIEVNGAVVCRVLRQHCRVERRAPANVRCTSGKTEARSGTS